MDTSQPQFRNLANKGDVPKHVALTAILKALATRAGPLLYVESHAFQLEAQLPSGRVEEWEHLIAALPDSEAKRAYLDIETPLIKKGRYLCSTGLAARLLNSRPQTDFLLCEKAAESRLLIKKELPAAVVLDDNAGLATSLSQRAGRYETVVALVDPYSIASERAKLPGWLTGVCSAAKPDGLVAALAFDWGGKEWPDSPSWPLRLAPIYERAPVRLALYANEPALKALPVERIQKLLKPEGDNA